VPFVPFVVLPPFQVRDEHAVCGDNPDDSDFDPDSDTDPDLEPTMMDDPVPLRPRPRPDHKG